MEPGIIIDKTIPREERLVLEMFKWVILEQRLQPVIRILNSEESNELGILSCIDDVRICI